MELLKFRITQGLASADVTFFNQSWMRTSIRVGETYYFYGAWDVTGSVRRINNPFIAQSVAIDPVYRLTSGLSQKVMSGLVQQAVELCVPEMVETMPARITDLFSLAPIADSIRAVHKPPDIKALARARKRLVFEELLTLQLGLSLLGKRARTETAVQVRLCDMAPYFQALPFALTKAQLRAISESLDDMRKHFQMNRLLQGDVGSGKTVVAAALCYAAVQSGYQAALMAPTELLAEQHANTVANYLKPHGISVSLLTGGRTAAARRKVLEEVQSGVADVAVGTHALIESGVKFKNLGLVVTDEQHRFGVRQRARLVEKGLNPHLLVMSATPIPRSLSLTIFGDLDLSVIDSMPHGRKPVETHVVGEEHRARINAFIRELIAEGRQVYIVCPLVEEGGDDRKAVSTYTQEVAARFVPHRVEGLHGRMHTAEKEAIMRRFASGEISVLVSTTVVEVGMDVPNAALMLVESAERYGLSQLHQLRGRVGRGQHQSHCILLSNAKGDAARARLKTIEQTNDGFLIAEKDLEMRGPGDFFGSRQHGLPDLSIADLSSDTGLVQAARDAAAMLLEIDPDLSDNAHQELKWQTVSLFSRSGIVLN